MSRTLDHKTSCISRLCITLPRPERAGLERVGTPGRRARLFRPGGPILSSPALSGRGLTALLAVATACLALLGGGPAARAGAYTYGTTPQRTVSAGILLVDGNQTATPPATASWSNAARQDNKDPYVFYVLSRRTDIVPFGWTIVNPLAPGAVTSQIKLRWDDRTGTTPNTPSYQLGQSITPAMAAYWEVPLTQTASSDLGKFDVLLLNVENACTLTQADVEKLRTFVEGGGTLWIEDSAGTGGSGVSFTVSPSLLFGAGTQPGGLQFQGNTAGTTGTDYAALPAFTRSSLITTPYQISENELNALGENRVGNFFSSNGVSLGTTPTLFTTLSVIVNNGPVTTAQPLVAAGQYGAGQVVVTCTGSVNAVNDYAGGVDIYGGSHPNSGPYCGTAYQLAPTADLKLTTDILASADGHPNERQNGHQSGASLSGLPAVAKSWADTDHAGGQAGATIYGHMAYVTKGGNLYAYDIYPSEILTAGSSDPDDGNATLDPRVRDYDLGKPYDVVWIASVGTNASAPTVALATVGGTTGPVAFVEKADGTLVAFNATDGAAFPLGSVPPGTASGTPYTNASAPAPAFFEGRVFMGNADGALEVIDLNGTATARTPFAVNPNKASDTSTPAIVASPTVGIVTDSRGDNDIVALCTTANGLYSVFLGSRGERLLRIGSGYNTKLGPLTNARLDTGATSLPYTASQANGLNSQKRAVLESPATTGGTTNYSAPPTPYNYDPFFANYNADIDASAALATTAAPAPLTRTLIGGAPSSGTPGVTSTNDTLNASVSTPALDRFGNVYYTVTNPATGNSTLFSVHDAPNATDVHINWRFLLPTSSGGDPGVDADGASYGGLIGYQFTTVGAGGAAATPVASAPVVDGQGNVYVLATKATTGSTAVLCFNGLGAVSADIGDPTAQQTGVSVTQPLGSGTDEFGGTTPPTLTPSEYAVSTGGKITFSSFGSESNLGSGVHAVYPNLNEPYPITVAYNSGGVQNQQAQSGVIRPLHTNLTWFTLLDNATITYSGTGGATTNANRPNVFATSGLTKAGTALYFVGNYTDKNGNVVSGELCSVTANPQTIAKKFVESSVNPYTTAANASGPPVFAPVGATGTGLTTAVPSAGNGVMLVNGAVGTTAFTNQITLVVDSNRVLEMDSNGDAQWAVDATTQTALAATGQFVTTTVPLNRPTSLTELTQNDYLVADTGNNRCVRFDRAGKVIWELTNFNDPNKLLKPGEPATLNQPTGVQITSTYDNKTGSPTYGDTTIHYLISDTGNYRVVEIDDVYDATLTLIGNHTLAWTSHTHDVQDRQYRYQSAAYYASPVSGKFYVVALITNKRLAPFTYSLTGTQTYGQAAPGFLAPANQDVAGGTIVLLDYDPANRLGSAGFGTNNQADGFIGTDPNSKKLIAVSTILTSLTATGGFATTAAGATPTNTLYIRNPRYLKVVTKQEVPTGGGAPVSVRHYLMADDNGVWDLDGNNNFQANFGFTQADYQLLAVPTLSSATTFSRTTLPFIPSSIQLLGTDTTTVGTVTASFGRYLITNSFSQGEAANDLNKVGGEVFEIDQANTLATQTGGYNSHTLSRPTNTSPLSQPAFAYRLQ